MPKISGAALYLFTHFSAQISFSLCHKILICGRLQDGHLEKHLLWVLESQFGKSKCLAYTVNLTRSPSKILQFKCFLISQKFLAVFYLQ